MLSARRLLLRTRTAPPSLRYVPRAGVLQKRPGPSSFLRYESCVQPLWSELTRSFSEDRAASSSASSGRRRATPRGSTQPPPLTKRQKELGHVVHALRLFHEREQHFAVPISFEVPRSTSWPSELRGLQLGIKTHKLMQLIAMGKPPKGSADYIEALEALRFPVYSWRQYNFDNVLIPALTSYSRHHGDLFVPQKFVVPQGDETLWPRETWGYQLGLQVSKLRREKRFLEDEDIDALDAIGFVWSVRDTKWNQYFLPGLRLYKELHGHVDVPLAFEIPREDSEENPNPWPSHLRGYHLGRHVYMVRSGKYATYAQESRSELEALGFAFDVSENLWHFTIFPALEAFAHVHGHCDVPQDFVVPAEDPWPENAYGWRLGHTVKSIRHQGVYEDQVRANRAELDRIGFVWNATDRVEVTFRRIVLPAMKTYLRLHGDTLVGTDFVVPDQGGGATTWPQQARGFRLGHWITRARAGQIELTRPLKNELDQLGFVWRFNDERWNAVLLPAFRAYAQIHGTCKGMSTKFHVPEDPAYPKRAWGVNLGGAMWHMKNGDTYVHDPVKERELKKLGVL